MYISKQSIKILFCTLNILFSKFTAHLENIFTIIYLYLNCMIL